MRWPWQSRGTSARVVASHGAAGLVYVEAAAGRIVRCGVEARGTDSAAQFTRRVRGLGLAAGDVVAVLPSSDYQLLQIDAPAVPPDEMKAAARWHIKGMVDAHLDDLTLDVMRVGDPRKKVASRRLFVVAANRSAVRETTEFMDAAGLRLKAIDIRETAQRNLQSAVAAARGSQRPTAALMADGSHCLLTLCAEGELYFARWLDWDSGTLQALAVPAAPERFPRAASDSEFGNLDVVDYSAGPEAASPTGRSSSLLIELQRSFDLWERSWPDTPLERLTLHLGTASTAVAALIGNAVALPVDVLEVERVFPGLHAGAGSPAVEQAVLPLLGALLRSEQRQL